MSNQGISKHKIGGILQENPISLQNSPIKNHPKQVINMRDSKTVNNSLEQKKKDVSPNQKKQSKQALNKILSNPKGDERNLGLFMNNNSRNQQEDFSNQQQNSYYYHQQPHQQTYHNNQGQGNFISMIGKKQENQNLSGLNNNQNSNANEQSMIYQTPPRTKLFSYNNWDSNLDSTLPNIHQNGKVSAKQQQLFQLQTTHKKQHSANNRANSQKTKKKEEILAPYIYGNNPFKNPQTGATLSGGFRYQPPPFMQTIKKSSKKNNGMSNYYNANPSLSENEADDEVNITYHHPYRNRHQNDNPLQQPSNVLEQILQPQKLNINASNTNNGSNPNDIPRTRASASLHFDKHRDMAALTDSEANDQTSLSRYNRKKYSVKRRSKEEHLQAIDSSQLSEMNGEEKIFNNSQYSLNNQGNQNKDPPIMTQRNNWSQSENIQKQENDKQYLTQYSNTMAQDQIQGQIGMANDQGRQHSTSMNGGIHPYLKPSHQSYDSMQNQIANLAPKSSHSTNAKIIDPSYHKSDHPSSQKNTEQSDTSYPEIQTYNKELHRDYQRNYADNLAQQIDKSSHNTHFTYEQQANQQIPSTPQQTEQDQEDNGKALSSVPSKPSYSQNPNENIRRLGDLQPISSHRNQRGYRREERANSYKMQHLEQKESQLVNMAHRENEYGNKMQIKKSSMGASGEMNQLLPHQNIILNSRMNEIKKQIQVKDIQRISINIDLNEKQKENKSKSKQHINGQNNAPQSQLSNHVNTHQSRRSKKTSSALDNGIYLYNNDFNFEDEKPVENQESRNKQQGHQSQQQNVLNIQSDSQDITSQSNASVAPNPSVKDPSDNDIVNNSDISTNISSPNPSILNERKNVQQQNEPYQRQRIPEKSYSQMPHGQKQPENEISNESFMIGKNSSDSQAEKRNQSNSLSPDPIGKNDSMMKSKLSKACIRFTVLGGGETIEAEDFSLRGIDANGQAVNKFRINIKNVVEIEEYMEQICSHLGNQSFDYMHSAEQFIMMINEDPQYNINQVHRFFSDDKLCRVGKVLTVLELISVYLIIKIGVTKKASIRQYYPKMKSLLTYTHQSFLLFWDQLYLLFSQNIQDKDCLERLRERIEEKRQVKLGNKKSSYLQLKQNYDIICNLIKPLIKEIKDISQDLAKLFKVFEDQSIVETFNQVKTIFGLDLNQYENNPKDQENEQNKQNLSPEKQTNSQPKKARNIKPYLPPNDNSNKPLTLVLDLDETLIHFFETRNGGQYQKRPFCDKFLREMNKYYEVVIFTAGTEDYANWVLDTLDKSKLISYRLFRQHTNFTNCVYVKDLSKIGRDLSKTIIVDNVPENFRLQRENGIGIKSWYNDRNDTALNDLIPALIELAQVNPEDVRVALKKLRQKYPPHKVRGNFDLPY